MNSAMKRVLGGGVAFGLVAALAACSGTGAGQTSASAEKATIEFWGWNQGQQAQVDAFNASQSNITVKYVKQADNTATSTGLQNSVKAGGEAACVVQSPNQLATLLVDGLIQPVDQIADKADLYTPAAIEAAKLGDNYYGIPMGANPTFILYNKAAYDAAGVAMPTTWQGLIDAGKQLKPKGISVFNLAGEDPSTLTNLAWQAGAQWFSIDGDTWKVDMLSDKSLEAADIVQQMVDNDIVSNETYAEWDALMQKFDSGTMVSIPTSTWQLAAYAQNFKNSLGNWVAADLPMFGDKLATPGGFGWYIVPKGCQQVDAAVTFANWLATDPESIKIAADTKTGAGIFPAVKDPTPYIDGLMDKTMLGDNATGAVDVVERALAATVTGWQSAPNQAAVDAEMADQWGKVVNKQQTVRQMLENVQAFTIADLQKRGINVAAG